MAELRLLRGQIALIDDEDLPKVAGYRWHFSKGYARSSVKIGENWETVYLHRLVMNAQEGEEFDHKNTIKLDCRKHNLRPATRKVQMANQPVRSTPSKSSRFKGVFLKRASRWGAQIQTKLGKKYLGYFSSEVEAARAYNAAAKDYFGEYALLNPV